MNKLTEPSTISTDKAELIELPKEYFICRDCKLNAETEFKHSFYNLPRADSTEEKRSRGMKTMEIKVSSVNGFQSIGVGHSPHTELCGFLNLPPPMTKTTKDSLFFR